MLIVNPKVELLEQGNDPVPHVARCARVCYNKETGNNDRRLYDDLIQKKHWSVFRHMTYYAVATRSSWDIPYFIRDLYRSKQKVVGIDVKEDNGCLYIVYNGNWALDYPVYHKQLSRFHVSPEHFANTETGHSMMLYTFVVTTQISTSRELNRVSPNSITEMSTRYVDLKNGAVCKPHWLSKEHVDTFNSFGLWDTEKYKNLPDDIHYYFSGIEHGFEMYQRAIKAGMRVEDARGILPLDTATKVIYTYDVATWRHIIELRSDKRAQPNCQIIANMIKKELEELGYDFQ